MSETIKALWNGDIAPCDRCGAHDQTVNELVGLMERNRNQLNEGLTPVQREVLQKYLDCADEFLLHMLELAFCEGFSLGSKLTVEALCLSSTR